ncbi:MAG: hypothetical protein HZB42_01245 [Sphingobacteriales bacterium]|nr:hypothetical protein [Sphingobacteriales bacterium]
MKRKYLIVMFSVVLSLSLFAQKKEKDEEEKGFKKDNLFTGGSVTVSFFSGVTILGASPLFGYKLANWLDGGVVFNYTYSGQRDVIEINDKIKQSVYGGGLFVRLYPVNFIFLQAQAEHNFTRLRYIPATNNYLPYKETVEANSLLIGGGYTQGRGPGSNTFYYLSILFDVVKNKNSPYVDLVYNPATNDYVVRAIPIIRAGINIGLFEGEGRRR